MRVPCAVVPKLEAPKFINFGLKRDYIDKTLKIVPKGVEIIVPLKCVPENIILKTMEVRIEEYDMPSRKASIGIREILNRNGINNRRIGWERLGNAIVFNRYFDGIEIVAKEIVINHLGQQVYLVSDKISNQERKPRMTLVYGKSGEIRMRENGAIFLFDPSSIMFSKGNVVERGLNNLKNLRISDAVDMFAGIGYFSLPLAKMENINKITSIDINPASISYLKKSAEVNGVSHKIQAVCMDCRNFYSPDRADLVLMGNFKSKEYLVHGLRRTRNNGYILLHHLEETSSIESSIYQISSMGKAMGYTLSLIESHPVKSYAPHTWHLSSIFRVTF